MDYEFRILLAEKELAHLREMQTIARSRQDVTDSGIAAIEQILARTEKNLEAVSAAQLVTELKLQGLIDALLREHPNGKP